MNLSLEDITADNYEAICELDVTKTQEEYVACNMWSLVEAHYNSGYTCKAIYLNALPVGFLCGYKKPLKRFLFGALW